MSHAFGHIDSQLDEEDGKANIFGSGGDSGSSSDSGGDTTGTGAFTTSSMDGSLSADPSGSNSQAAAPGAGGYNPSDYSSAYNEGSKRMNPQQKLSSLGQKISTSQQKLQDDSNSYITGAQGKTKEFGIDDATLDSAVSGDDTAFQTTSGRLGKTKADLYDGFSGLKSEELPSVQILRDPSQFFAEDAGPDYTTGQSRFDGMMLRRNPEFMRIQRELLGQHSALEKDNDRLRDEKTTEARKIIDDGWDTATGDIRNRLGTRSQSVIDAAKQRELEEDTRRKSLDRGAIEKEKEEYVEKLMRQDVSSADPRSEQARAMSYLDEDFDFNGYFKFNDDTEYTDFIDDTGASKFNSVMKLLGKEDMISAGDGPSADYEFDEQGGYKALMDHVTGKRRGQDTSNLSRIDQLKEQARARGEGEMNRLSGLTPEQRAQIGRDQLREALAAEGWGGDMGEVNNFDPSQYWQDAAFDHDDLMSAEEADELNRLSTDTGLDERFQNGSGFGSQRFDSNTLKSALKEMIKNRPLPAAPKAPDNPPPTTEAIQDATDKVFGGASKGGYLPKSSGDAWVPEINEAARNVGSTAEKMVENPSIETVSKHIDSLPGSGKPVATVKKVAKEVKKVVAKLPKIKIKKPKIKL